MTAKWPHDDIRTAMILRTEAQVVGGALVAEEGSRAPETDDAKLLNVVRAGDGRAFEVLRERHGEAARRLACDLVVSPAEIEDVVTETFSHVLDAVRRGGGPSDGFRPYLLTAVRRVCDVRSRRQRAPAPMQEQPMSDPGLLLLDPAMASLADAQVVRAYLSLPERWSAVLWHTEIEQEYPADVAPLFALSLNGLAALERRAREGLRQAYLKMYVARVTRPECRPVAERLGVFLRYAMSAPETAEVASHLDECDECRLAYSELADIGATLRSQVAPVFLGGAAASYLSSPRHGIDFGPMGDAVSTEAGEPYRLPADAALLGAGAASRADGPSQPGGGHVRRGPPWLRHWSGRQRWLAAIGCAVLILASLAIAVAVTGHETGPQSQAEAAAAGRQKTTTHSAPSPASPTSRSSASPSAAGNTSMAPSAPEPSTGSSPSLPTATPAPSPTASQSPGAQLAATVDVYGGGFGGVQVAFSVTDTGSAATGELTAVITLPSGSSLAGDGFRHHHHHDDSWTCQPTASGASCQHAAESAGQSAQGTIQVQVTGPAACGQAVQLTATTGSASTSAQSPEVIQC